ncbi:hypothetical protein NIES4075_23260 [Tolypothrix sp. NIES-4075]|uniref:IS4 family transposase n=1 Tax=Tolypothrix sp. NIES-4075 TaxID=2005459 RepID=UPI000B5C1CE5|nr:hypothetical protein NIES4075_23260 [Tolypothrix sp. NIES-4075]
MSNADDQYHVIPAQDPMKNNWEFMEVWIDPSHFPPYVLLLLCDSEENCQISDPAQGYKVVFSTNNYDADFSRDVEKKERFANNIREQNPVQFVTTVELSETKKRSARTATLEVRFCPVSISPPKRLKLEGSFNVYAVYAREIDVPENCEPVEWMLLTTESVTTQQLAAQILRWYTYRWRVEEYHKILKSGCQAESYRLAGESMSTMLGFLTVIAAQLLRMTYLHRTSPQSSATEVLTKIQMDVLLASTPPLLKKDVEFTIDWAIRAIARLGGYLEHRKNSAIGIQVLWRGWLELETLCQGWLLHDRLYS